MLDELVKKVTSDKFLGESSRGKGVKVMPDSRPGDVTRTGSTMAVSGLQFAVSVIVFLFLGQWLDKKFGTSPVFLFVCVFVGAGAALYSMYRKLNAINAAEDEMRRKNK